MSPQASTRRTLEDIERLERVPLARRLAVGSTYALLHKAVTNSPEQPARCFLPLGGSVPAGRSAHRACLPGEGAPDRQFAG